MPKGYPSHQCRGAKSFVDDLVHGRGVVLSRAATSLRSIETKPFDWKICPHLDGHISGLVGGGTCSVLEGVHVETVPEFTTGPIERHAFDRYERASCWRRHSPSSCAARCLKGSKSRRFLSSPQARSSGMPLTVMREPRDATDRILALAGALTAPIHVCDNIQYSGTFWTEYFRQIGGDR